MRALTICLLGLQLLGAAATEAQLPRTMSHQGLLRTAEGPIVPDGNYDFRFRLYDDASAGALMWEEAHEATLVEEGIYNVVFGEGSPAPVPLDLPFDQPYWLSVQIGADPELSPRIELTSSPYALRAAVADSVVGGSGVSPWNLSGTTVYYDEGAVGIGTNESSEAMLTIEGSGYTEQGRSLELRRFGSNSETWQIYPSTGSTPGLCFYNKTDGVTRLFLADNGRVGVGTRSPTSELTVVGTTKTDVLEITGGADLAECFALSPDVTAKPGEVVVIDATNAGHVRPCVRAYDSCVVGVVCGAGGVFPGVTLGQDDRLPGDTHVALAGRVYCSADASFGSIHPGDRLTTSTTPGHAMKASDRGKASGAVIGKAMTSLESGRGLVLVVIQPQ